MLQQLSEMREEPELNFTIRDVQMLFSSFGILREFRPEEP